MAIAQSARQPRPILAEILNASSDRICWNFLKQKKTGEVSNHFQYAIRRKFWYHEKNGVLKFCEWLFRPGPVVLVVLYKSFGNRCNQLHDYIRNGRDGMELYKPPGNFLNSSIVFIYQLFVNIFWDTDIENNEFGSALSLFWKLSRLITFEMWYPKTRFLACLFDHFFSKYTTSENIFFLRIEID